MSMFGTIMSKIFGHSASATSAPAAAQATATPGSAPTDTTVQQPAATAATPAQTVDVGAVLAGMAAQSGQPSNYKTSIVDLMKLLGLDSSLEARTTLAHELNYSGNTQDSAAMNIWLHKEVMTKLEQNGGIVPAELKGG